MPGNSHRPLASITCSPGRVSRVPAMVSIRPCLTRRSAWKRRPSLTSSAFLINQSVDMRFSSVSATAEGKAGGDRVGAALAKGLAAPDAPDRKQAATPRTEARHSNPCIIGAAGVEAAALTEQGAQPALVESQK